MRHILEGYRWMWGALRRWRGGPFWKRTLLFGLCVLRDAFATAGRAAVVFGGAVIAAGGLALALLVDEPAPPVFDPAEIRVNSMATLHLANDSVLAGIAVKVRAADGSERYGLFRGPRKLGDVMTRGSWVFNADSLPPRVRLVAEGDRLHGGNQ